jgi:catabolite regulation protein CreA
MRSTIDVAAKSLAEVAPLLALAAEIVGSEASGEVGVVRLVIEGPGVPDVPRVTCTVSKWADEKGGRLNVTFMPAMA